MKTRILMIVSALLFIGSVIMAQNQPKVVNMKPYKPKKVNGPVAKYDTTSIDLGELTQYSPGTARFHLTNNGNEPLVISAAKASCGCTNLSYGKDPVLPGKTIIIAATYNAAAVGEFSKTITVRTNASIKPVVLLIKGKVVGKTK